MLELTWFCLLPSSDFGLVSLSYVYHCCPHLTSKSQTYTHTDSWRFRLVSHPTLSFTSFSCLSSSSWVSSHSDKCPTICPAALISTGHVLLELSHPHCCVGLQSVLPILDSSSPFSRHFQRPYVIEVHLQGFTVNQIKPRHHSRKRVHPWGVGLPFLPGPCTSLHLP